MVHVLDVSPPSATGFPQHRTVTVRDDALPYNTEGCVRCEWFVCREK
jgi:hypothetical protein